MKLHDPNYLTYFDLVGESTTYLSVRSVAGFPYLAESKISLAVRKADGVLYWKPRGPFSTLGPRGVPESWHREGTASALGAQDFYANAPKPWESLADYLARVDKPIAF